MIGDNNIQQNKGFTIIEIIFSMAIFMFVIGAVITLFILFVENQRNIIYEQKVLSQMSYVQEYMSKALRMAKVDKNGNCIENNGETGYIYMLTRGIVTGNPKGIKFINQSDNDSCYEFFLDDTDSNHKVLKMLKDSTNDADAVSLTSDDIQIQSIQFVINGDMDKRDISVRDNGLQPRITFVFTIMLPNGSTRTLQTTVSQRNFN